MLRKIESYSNDSKYRYLLVVEIILFGAQRDAALLLLPISCENIVIRTHYIGASSSSLLKHWGRCDQRNVIN